MTWGPRGALPAIASENAMVLSFPVPLPTLMPLPLKDSVAPVSPLPFTVMFTVVPSPPPPGLKEVTAGGVGEYTVIVSAWELVVELELKTTMLTAPG
jgi:hypothetical protein